MKSCTSFWPYAPSLRNTPLIKRTNLLHTFFSMAKKRIASDFINIQIIFSNNSLKQLSADLGVYLSLFCEQI